MNMTPREIVSELDRYIVGQKDAKKAVAIAIRNRWRRRQIPQKLQDEIVPRNILMVGSTGVGKTEIARRIAKLVSAPFIKVEATKFTEVGYVGRDVDSIIRDLIGVSINMTQSKHVKRVEENAMSSAKKKIAKKIANQISLDATDPSTIEQIIDRMDKGEFDTLKISVSIDKRHSAPNLMGGPDIGDNLNINFSQVTDAIGKFIFTNGTNNSKNDQSKKVEVRDAIKIYKNEEVEKLIDNDAIIREALESAEQNGIVFIDEIDKIVAQSSRGGNSDISREGVQRDLLPLIEGTSVNSKYGQIKTDHILFIASGAFHMAKPSDMLPELQGRLPVRVQLSPLTQEDMARILTDPEFNIIQQMQTILTTEGVDLAFSDCAISKIAELATLMNRDIDDIGARRLHAIVEKIVEDISYTAPEIKGKEIIIDEKYVENAIDFKTNTDNMFLM